MIYKIPALCQNLFMNIDFEKLRNYRLELGLKQSDVAKKVGMPKQVLYAYEKGHQRPTLRFFPAICNLYGQPMEYFLKQDSA